MTHKLDRLPEAKPLLLKAAATITRKPRGNIVIPALGVEVQGVRADPARLAAYADLCGFAPADTLPITFPQVQAASLHMWLMTQPEFPLPLLGIVHLRNTFRQAAPLPADAAYTVRATLGESRRIRIGLEFDILTEYLDESGAVAQSALMTVFHRMKTDESLPRVVPEAPRIGLADYASFDVPADQGRRYAPVGQDYNPIHLYALTARLFGFPRAIAHGMWALARCAGALESQLPAPARELNVQFRNPLLLPGKVALKFAGAAGGVNFALLSRRSDKLHLTGSIK